jgi:hypothetical protein
MHKRFSSTTYESLQSMKPKKLMGRSGGRGGIAGAVALAFGLTMAGWQSDAHADALTKAKRLHDRIANVPPSDAVLNQMATLIGDGSNQANNVAAAAIATANPSFYNVTIKNFAAPWTNRDSNVFVPLNDYTATVIGMVRDNEPFNTLLSADILYVGNGIQPGYSPSDNAHYAAMEANNTDLSVALTKVAQSSQNGLSPDHTAGIFTTRGAAEAFFIDGTNRAMFRFTMLNHLCHDMEQVHDVTRAPDRIRQDVARSPGADSRLFLNGCVGCHSGMDPLAQAFAYYNFDKTAGRIVHTQGQVQPKYLINSDNFKPGYVTDSDAWENRWRAGQNSLLGWPTGPTFTGRGNGAKSMGAELANSDAFAQCQVEKVFKRVCFRAPSDTADRAEVTRIVGIFKGNNSYSLKRVFQEAGVYCMGQ